MQIHPRTTLRALAAISALVGAAALRALRLASTQGHPFGLLVDGELVEADAEVEFTLAACEVDLLATETDGL